MKSIMNINLKHFIVTTEHVEMKRKGLQYIRPVSYCRYCRQMALDGVGRLRYFALTGSKGGEVSMMGKINMIFTRFDQPKNT